MKKIIPLLLLVLFLAGCSFFQPQIPRTLPDGSYLYQNKDLGFAITLPPSFDYYQTQRKATESFIDLEIFVPTADRIYFQEAAGYAKPIIIRIFSKQDWQNLPAEDEKKKNFIQVGQKRDKIYALGFWSKPPADWLSIWSEEIKGEIIKSFKSL